MLWVHPLGVSMSDGDTRKVNEEVLKDPNAKWKPLEQFRGFERAIKSGCSSALGLIWTLNIVFGLGGNSSSVG